MQQGLRCPNRVAWSLDDRLMYLCGSWVRRIYVYDFNADDGILRDRGPFAKPSEEYGLPDGLTENADGGVWSAHYDGRHIKC